MGKVTKKKYPIYFYLLALIAPIIFIAIFEVFLRYFDYGNDYSVFIRLKEKYQDFLVFNPNLPKKYFSSNLAVPSVIPDAFVAEKPKNDFRIFVLGESSVAGFPYPPNVSFPRFIKRKLEIYYPEKYIEVINLGISAINSNTLKDIAEAVAEQKPDLILIYTGHNEYYGAFGAASSSSLFINDFVIALRNYRTYQLLENIFSKTLSVFFSNNNTGKTLMASMVGNKLIEEKSDEYYNGINFFKKNMAKILEQFYSLRIPVIISTLMSNEMQKPLESSVRLSQAEKLFNQGIEFYENANYSKSKKLLMQAKEADAMRFRAPMEINNLIRDFAAKKISHLLDAEKYFRSISKSEILEKDYFVDHLHLNISANKILADLFIQKIQELNILPTNKRIKNEADNIDKLLSENIPFTNLDSSYSAYSIKLLTSTFPFTKNLDANSILIQFQPQNISDSLALMIIRKIKSFDKAHFELGLKYFKQKKYFEFYKEMNSLIEDKPFEKSNYYNAVNLLMKAKQYELVFPILKKLEHRFPDSFCFKKLADLYFAKQSFSIAINYLNQAKQINPFDPEIFFNLSRINFILKNFNEAFNNIRRCIELNPDYPNAENIFKALKKELDKK